MYDMKDKDITITGHHNYCDGLWDLPVQKAQIKSYNYIVSIPRPSIYPFRIPLAH